MFFLQSCEKEEALDLSQVESQEKKAAKPMGKPLQGNCLGQWFTLTESAPTASLCSTGPCTQALTITILEKNCTDCAVIFYKDETYAYGGPVQGEPRKPCVCETCDDNGSFQYDDMLMCDVGSYDFTVDITGFNALPANSPYTVLPSYFLRSITTDWTGSMKVQVGGNVVTLLPGATEKFVFNALCN